MLELNVDHHLVKYLEKRDDAADFGELAMVIFEQATLAEGAQLPDPGAFVQRLNSSGHGLSNDDLLRPTLSDYRKPPALYNSTGFFLSAFFGGPLGAAMYGTANCHRLGRLSRDLPVIVGITAVASWC